jgi:hypothetical protein
MDDPRGFRRMDSHPGREGFRIAWISGSGTQVIWPLSAPDGKVDINEFMPMYVQPKVSARIAKDVDIFLYVLQAGTPLDKYFAVNDALSRGADLIIYEVNPIYDFLGVVSSLRQNLFATAARRMFSSYRVASRVLSLAMPMDVIAALVQYRLPAIGDRWSYYQLLSRYLAISIPKVASTSKRVDPTSPQAKIAAASDSWNFWPAYGNQKPRDSACQRANLAGQKDWCTHVEAALAASAPDASRGSAEITDGNIRLVLASGIPSIVYLSPISSSTRREPALAALYAQEGQRLTKIGASMRTPRSCIKTEHSENVLVNQIFSDSVHLRYSEPMATEMVETIVSFLRAGACK